MFLEDYVTFLPWGSYNRLLQVNHDVNKHVVGGVRGPQLYQGSWKFFFFVFSQLKKLHCHNGCRWFLNSFHFVLIIFVNGAIKDFSNYIYHDYKGLKLLLFWTSCFKVMLI